MPPCGRRGRCAMRVAVKPDVHAGRGNAFPNRDVGRDARGRGGTLEVGPFVVYVQRMRPRRRNIPSGV